MDNENKGGDPESRETHGLKISDLLKVLTEEKPRPPHTTHTDPRNITSTISTLKGTRGTFRSRAVLPDNISRLSKCEYRRWDHLSESSPASNTAQREGCPQPTTATSGPVTLLHLLERPKTLPSDSVGERFTKLEIHPNILGVEVWTKQLSLIPSTVSTQTGPINQWFFENLTDLQRKLFSGASKKHGVPRTHQIPGQRAHHTSPEPPSSSPPPPLKRKSVTEKIKSK